MFHFSMHAWPAPLSHNLLCPFWPLVSKVIVGCLQDFTLHGIKLWYYQKLLLVPSTVVQASASIGDDPELAILLLG